MYTLDYINAPEADDVAIALGDALTVYVARDELPLVSGTQMDYVREGLNATLQFKNANAQSYCGCGESFSVG
jgi:iron-sulfur cluster assembly accessory protein